MFIYPTPISVKKRKLDKTTTVTVKDTPLNFLNKEFIFFKYLKWFDTVHPLKKEIIVDVKPLLTNYIFEFR